MKIQPELDRPIFRNPELYQVDALRECIRQDCPPGPAGFIAEDLDLVCRVFGEKYDTDSTGRVMLVEVKHGTKPLGPSKERTFGLIDRLLRAGAKELGGNRYRGYYVIRHDTDGWRDKDANIRVNGVRMDYATLLEFLQFADVDARPLWSDNNGL
jgi:hypothetical protein